MRRTITIVIAVMLTMSLVGIAVGAERTKQSTTPMKDLDRLEAALAAYDGASIPTGDASTQEYEVIGEATVRIWGRNRYETAAAVSEFWWNREDAFAVYLATGEDFPDALAAGPSTFFLGPLLLVRRDVLPEPTRAELERLGPCFIIAVGGSGIISEAVLEEADQYTTDECFFEE